MAVLVGCLMWYHSKLTYHLLFTHAVTVWSALCGGAVRFFILIQVLWHDGCVTWIVGDSDRLRHAGTISSSTAWQILLVNMWSPLWLWDDCNTFLSKFRPYPTNCIVHVPWLHLQANQLRRVFVIHSSLLLQWKDICDCWCTSRPYSWKLYPMLFFVCRGKCSVIQLTDVQSVRRFVPDPDTFFTLLGYNPDTRRLATIQGEIRIGFSHQVSLSSTSLAK